MDGQRLVRVTGVLFRAPRLPMGDVSQNLTFLCCLTPDNRLDGQAWRDNADYWTATGSLPRRGAFAGRLVRQDDSWVLHGEAAEDEPQWLMLTDCLRPGEYFTLCTADDDELVFRVVNVHEATD